MLLAPGETWSGALLLALGVSVEVIGIAIKRENQL